MSKNSTPIEIVEWCPNCGTQNTFKDWDGEFEKVCTCCNSKLMLCSECTYLHDYENQPDCDWSWAKETCFRMKKGGADMSDTKRYPTRMHEILGVEPNERFKVQNWHEKNEAYVDDKGDVILVLSNEFPQQLDAHHVCLLVNHPERIIRRPRLTEAQIKYLKAALTLEFGWLAKDADDRTYFYETKPTKFPKNWGCRAQSIKVFVEQVSDLVSWDDPEPLDIAATLKAAGVET